MQRILLTLFLVSAVLSSLDAQTGAAQNPNGIDESKRMITPLANGKFEIKEITYSEIPVYIGELISVDPMIRDGRYCFYDLNGNVIATGNYVEDIPTGKWIYFDSDKDTLCVLDYQKIWEFLEKEDEHVAYDTVAISALSKWARRSMNEDGTFKVVDELPIFDDDYYSSSLTSSLPYYFSNNLILPVFAEKYKITDNVIIEFTIDYMGKIRNPEVLQSSLPDLSIEAIRALLASEDNWKPAKVEGIPVNVRISWEFDFLHAINYNDTWYEPPLVPEDSIVLKELTLDTMKFYIVEEMPLFNNGDPAIEFRKYISSEMVYPPEAKEKGYQGRVIVQFSVDGNGVVCNPIIIKGVNPLINEEAIRVVMSSPRWTPGRQRGKSVSVRYTFPINFVLPEGI